MLNYSRKVIFTILAIALLGSVSLAYALTYEFTLKITDADGAGGAFSGLRYVTTNSTDHIFVVEGGNDRVSIFNSAGTFVDTFGSTGNGDGQFNDPQGIAVNSTHIIVSDANNDDIQIFDLSGNFADTFGSGGTTGGLFADAQDVAVNSTHIFVTDFTNKRVQIFDLSGNFASTFGFDVTDGGGVGFEICTASETCKIGVSGEGDGQFSQTRGIAVNATHILVTDAGNERVSIFDPSGNFVDKFGISGTDEGDFANVFGIDFDSSGNIIVAENNNHRVQIFDPSGNFVSMFGFGVDDGTAVFQTCTSACQIGTVGSSDGQFNGPFGTALDSNDRIIVSESSGNNRVQVFSLATATTDKPSGGSGDQKHKTRPTFGLSHTTFSPLVEGGFSFNGKSHDITDNFWTPFAEQEVKLGQSNSFSAKVLAEKKLMVQEFLFGIPVVGEAHNAELGVEIFYDSGGEIERVQVIQKTDIIDVDSVKIIHAKSKCLSNETDEKCVTTLLSMKFLEPLKDKIMAIKAIDFKGRTHITYLNDGFDISGDSLNPMNTKLIPGTQKYEGLIEITQTAKYSDIWIANDGREFQINESGSVNQINQSSELPIETGALKNRNSIEFSALKLYQINKAQILAEQLYPHYSDESFGEINDIFAYGDPQFIAKNQVLKAEIDRDDRSISVILAEERAMKKILADERAYLKQISLPQQ